MSYFLTVTHLISTEMFLSYLRTSATCTVIIIIINIWRKCRRALLHLSIVAAIVHILDANEKGARSSHAMEHIDPFLMEITSFRLESECVHIGATVPQCIMQFGYRWSTDTRVSSAPPVAYNGCFSPDDISWFAGSKTP